jgi:hypothetical protein
MSRQSTMAGRPERAALPDLGAVEACLDRLYVAADGASLRRSERKKAVEVRALLEELVRALPLWSLGDDPRQVHGGPRGERRGCGPPRIVDAAAGKAYLGLVAAELLLAGREGAHVITIERDPGRAEAARRAAQRVVAEGVTVEVTIGDVADASRWPPDVDAAVALHACGPAADAIIEAACAASVPRLLLVPCCVGDAVAASRRGQLAADRLGLPRAAPVRRPFVASWVASEGALRLEALGYQTELVSFVPGSVTPENTLFRARRVREPTRMADAATRLADLQEESRLPSAAEPCHARG